MANTILITANWNTGALSQQTISRQYDNNRYAVRFVDYPEASDGNELDYYLLVWMSTAPGQKPGEITPIQLNSDQWYISNYFTQQVQVIKFQLCVLNEAGTYEAHSPIFSGRIGDSLEHDGTSQDIDVSTLFDAYREYVEELIIRAGAVIIDPTLTQPGQAADAKETGDKISEITGELNAQYSGDHIYEISGNDIDQYIDVGVYDTHVFGAYHSALSYTSDVTSFYIGAYDAQKQLVKPIIRKYGDQESSTKLYTLPNGTKYLRVVGHSTQSAEIRITTHKINSFDLVQKETFVNVLSRYNFERGAWESNSKTSSSIRLRHYDRVIVHKGETISFSDSSDLYFSVSVYENDTATTVLETSGWTSKQYTFMNDGYACINVSNGETHATSTSIVLEDLTTDLKILNKNFNDYIENNSNIKVLGVDGSFEIKPTNNSIDTKIDVPNGQSYLFIKRGAITYNSATSFAVQDSSGETNVDMVREYGSHDASAYILAIPSNATKIRIVLHTNTPTDPLLVGFISKNSVTDALLEEIENTKIKDQFVLSIESSKSFVAYKNGVPLPFRYASKSLGSGITMQDIQYTTEGTYILSSENDGVVFVSNAGEVTFKAVTEFGHGIAIQKLTNGTFMVASADENYGTADAHRNIYHYNYETNTVLDSFTPDIDDLMSFAWDYENGKYLIVSQPSDNMQSITAYMYDSTNDTKEIIGTDTMPSTYMQGGCVHGNYLYLSSNDGWNNIGKSFILIYDLETFERVNTIILTGIFREVEGVSLYVSHGDAYMRFGESHVVRLFDAKLN